jgi:hypothetical protein
MSRLVRLLVDRMRMLREDAVAVSKVVEDAFAGNTELDDELLDKDVRQVFYSLQDEKVLAIRREERREDGVDRRHYLWHVPDVDPGLGPQRAAPDPDARVYERLGDGAWERRRPGT